MASKTDRKAPAGQWLQEEREHPDKVQSCPVQDSLVTLIPQCSRGLRHPSWALGYPRVIPTALEPGHVPLQWLTAAL